jgi:hypothetical protein
MLLRAWEEQITAFPGHADDECLNVAFNLSSAPPQYFWLPKEYARYAFWIYAKPIIDHPEIPAYTNNTHFRTLGLAAVDQTKSIANFEKARPLPRSVIIDVGDRAMLLRDATAPGVVTAIAPVTFPLYVRVPKGFSLQRR